MSNLAYKLLVVTLGKLFPYVGSLQRPSMLSLCTITAGVEFKGLHVPFRRERWLKNLPFTVEESLLRNWKTPSKNFHPQKHRKRHGLVLKIN
jgi:hypothetical protein